MKVIKVNYTYQRYKNWIHKYDKNGLVKYLMLSWCECKYFNILKF